MQFNSNERLMTPSPAGEGTLLLNVERNREENEISGTTNDMQLTFGGSFVPPGAEVNNQNENQSTEIQCAMNNTGSAMTTQETFTNNKASFKKET